MSSTPDIAAILAESAALKQKVAQELAGPLAEAAQMLVACYGAGGKVLVFGNGGSAADAQHFAAELVGRFEQERPPLAAVALHENPSTVTSIGNDYGYDEVFARPLEAFARPGDVVLAISTSGNSPNVVRALETAVRLGLPRIGLTGRDGGRMRELCEPCIVVPHASTARIQEVHITVLHAWCAAIEAGVFGA